MKPPACALCGQSIFLEPPSLERATALAERILGELILAGALVPGTTAAARAATARTLLEAEGETRRRFERAAEGLLEAIAAAGDSDAYAAELARLEGEAGERWPALELFDDPGEKPDEPPAHRGRT